MGQLLVLLTIGLPWVGALLVWWIGDKHARLQHTLAVLFFGRRRRSRPGAHPALQFGNRAEHFHGRRVW